MERVVRLFENMDFCEKKEREREKTKSIRTMKQFIEWKRIQCKQIEFIELRPQLSHQFIALKGNEGEEEVENTK